MRSIEVGAGTVTITDEIIQIDISPIGVVKRLYKQSKLIVGLLIAGLLFEIVVAIFYLSSYRNIKILHLYYFEVRAGVYITSAHE